MTYGIGTHSFLNSTEHRQMKKERAKVTKKFESQPRKEVVLPLLCFCRSFRFSHELSAHRQLISDRDWRLPEERSSTEYWERIS